MNTEYRISDDTLETLKVALQAIVAAYPIWHDPPQTTNESLAQVAWYRLQDEIEEALEDREGRF